MRTYGSCKEEPAIWDTTAATGWLTDTLERDSPLREKKASARSGWHDTRFVSCPVLSSQIASQIANSLDNRGVRRHL